MSNGKGDSTPDAIKPFNTHGCNLELHTGGGDWVGDCPFCGKDSHLYVDPKTGMYDCKVCGVNGNAVTFMTEFAKLVNSKTQTKHWRSIAKDRGIPAGLLKARGLGYYAPKDRWLIPAMSEKGTVRDLRWWHPKFGLRSTAACKTQLFGIDRITKNKTGTVWVCEGEWDAMAMDWLIREADSISGDVAVAVPGAGVLKKEWLEALRGRNVVCAYDADMAGDNGAERANKLLPRYAKSVRFVRWPDTMPEGWDLRDFAKTRLGGGSPADEAVAELMTLISSKPRRQATAGSDGDSDGDGSAAATSAGAPVGGGKPLRKMSFAELVKEFKAKVIMNDDMVIALKVIMATCLSTHIKSDPLWVYLVGPPSAGKTMLLQPLQGSDHCVFRSTITPHGLVSGWRDGNDPSLIPKLSGRAFIVKDFTEILSMPVTARDEIYSTLRGAYDGAVDKSFGNGVHRVYNRWSDPPFEGFAMVAGVTQAIHGHREASLGERFLKFQLQVPTEMHQAAINAAALNSIGSERVREDRLQWASACYLNQTITAADLPLFDDDLAERLNALVQLVAHMRAQVDVDWRRNNEVSYRPIPEAGARLTKQLGQLARLLAFIDGKDMVDAEVFDVIQRVAFDTAYGFHLEVIDAMMLLGGSASKTDISKQLGLPSSTINNRFEALEILKAIEKGTEPTKTKAVGRPSIAYKVSNQIAKMWTITRGKDSTWKPNKKTKQRRIIKPRTQAKRKPLLRLGNSKTR